MLASEAAAARDTRLAAHEITVLADKSLPYEVVRKVMATCTAASYGKISLAVIERDTPLDTQGPGTV
jgi:biopolymer transport protein ExbD